MEFKPHKADPNIAYRVANRLNRDLGHNIVRFYHPGESNPITEITADVAATPKKRAIGLSQHEQLHPATGMLFVSPGGPPEREETFHVGGVKFPFDLIFIRKDGTIGKIVHNIYPDNPGRWGYKWTNAVVEVVGGFCKAHEIGLRDLVQLGNQHIAQSDEDCPDCGSDDVIVNYQCNNCGHHWQDQFSQTHRADCSSLAMQMTIPGVPQAKPQSTGQPGKDEKPGKWKAPKQATDDTDEQMPSPCARCGQLKDDWVTFNPTGEILCIPCSEEAIKQWEPEPGSMMSSEDILKMSPGDWQNLSQQPTKWRKKDSQSKSHDLLRTITEASYHENTMCACSHAAEVHHDDGCEMCGCTEAGRRTSGRRVARSEGWQAGVTIRGYDESMSVPQLVADTVGCPIRDVTDIDSVGSDMESSWFVCQVSLDSDQEAELEESGLLTMQRDNVTVEIEMP